MARLFLAFLAVWIVLSSDLVIVIVVAKHTRVTEYVKNCFFDFFILLFPFSSVPYGNGSV